MWIESLVLQDFRNYENQKLAFSPGLNLLVGNNGEGKTNLLEAIFVLATTKSHRTPLDSDLIRFGAGHYYLACRAHRQGRSEKIELGYSLSRKQKIAKLSGARLPRLSEVVGAINVVLFSPEDLELVKGSPFRRRRFIDIVLSQSDRAYLHNLQHYNRILAQRNNCLRLIQGNRFPTDILDTWDEQFAAIALKVTEKRVAAMKELQQFFSDSAMRISTKEKLSIRYNQAFSFTEEKPLLERLRSSRHKDIKRGTTPYGPHRDDILVLLNGRMASHYASQGQQRTAVLALKLAELEYIQRATGESPILLLDDVFSELDDLRRASLVSVLSGDVQSVLTGTKDDQFACLNPAGASVYHVEQGKVI